MQTTCYRHTFIADNNATKALTILKMLLQDYHPRNFSVRLWDGSQWPAETDPPRFQLIFKHPAALWCMLRNATTDLSISEAYIRKDLDVEGDFGEAIVFGFYLLAHNFSPSTVMRALYSYITPLGARSRRSSRRGAASGERTYLSCVAPFPSRISIRIRGRIIKPLPSGAAQA
jgi:hypothetical protein